MSVGARSQQSSISVLLLDVFNLPTLLYEVGRDVLTMALFHTLLCAQKAEGTRDSKEPLGDYCSSSLYKPAVALTPLRVSHEDIAEFHQGDIGNTARTQ